jgi:hypothetical protein
MTMHIDAPVEKVFPFFKDPMALADITLVDTEYFDVKETRQGTGTFYSWRTKLAGIPLEGFDVYTDVVANKHITDKSSSALVGTWDYSFEPEENGTKVTIEHHSRSIWRLAPLAYLMDQVRARMMASFIPQVKERIESSVSKTAKAAKSA